MWGVTLNPGSHRGQKNHGVTRIWSAAPRLINAETKKQSRARRLSVGLFSFRASWGSEQLTRWQGQETPPQSAGNGSLLWVQHTWQFCSMPPSPLQQMDSEPPRPHKIPPVGRRLWRPIWVASHFAKEPEWGHLGVYRRTYTDLAVPLCWELFVIGLYRNFVSVFVFQYIY